MKLARIHRLLFAIFLTFGQQLFVVAQSEHQHTQTQANERTFTLDQLEAAALISNPEIRFSARQVAVAEARVPAAGALDDPSLMYRGWGVPLARPLDANQAQHMFMIGQSFSGRGKRALRSEIAGQDIEIAKAELEAKKREVTAEVRKAFFQLLRTGDELRIHDQQVAIAKQAAESARTKYVLGTAPQQDVLKAQIALAQLVDHLIMIQQDGDLARADLNTLIGRDASAPLRVSGQYSLLSELPSLSELEAMAQQNRPELLAAAASIEQNNSRLALARRAYTPDYTISAGYMLQPEGTAFRNSYMAELSIGLPWLNRRKHEGQISEAMASVSVDTAAYEARRAIVFLEIQQGLIKAASSKRLAELYRDTLRPQAQATLKATVTAYENNRTDFLNLLDSQNTSLDVEFAYFKALAGFDEAVADLEKAVGAAIPRRNTKAAEKESRQ